MGTLTFFAFLYFAAHAQGSLEVALQANDWVKAESIVKSASNWFDFILLSLP